MPPPGHPRDLLLASRLEPDAVSAILAPYRFLDPAAVDADLQRIADAPLARRLLAEIVSALLAAAGDSADPDQALSLFERFARAALNRDQLLSYLADDPRTIDLLMRTFGASPFMAEILIRDPASFYWLADPEVLGRPRALDRLREDLSHLLAPLRTHASRLDALRRLKRREILHIGVRDLAALSTVEQTIGALSTLADVLIQGACAACASELRQSHCEPPTDAPDPLGFAVIALGKLGGGELNFSSDVDLFYVAATADELPALAAALRVPLPDFHDRLARALTTALSSATNEGYVFRVDLRLRPEGRAGALVQTLPMLKEYYGSRGATWERLALVKARHVAGDVELARRFLEASEGFVYERGLDSAALADVRELKARIDQQMAERGQTLTHVKLGLGGIREIELIVQALQLAFGRGNPELRTPGTLAALAALAAAGHLRPEECATLVAAYLFLRDVENKLQMVHDTQSHQLPDAPLDRRRCALRLGYRDAPGRDAGEALMADYRTRTSSVSALFRRLFDPTNASRFVSAR
jgi:[glutamine synthetase] adenylyltransferase / [glutamine synthetase]-adenylyl-L-tyrosine phosphorylase